MDYSSYIKNYQLDRSKLLKFGFEEENNCLTLEKDLDYNGVYANFKLKNNSFEVDVYDKNFKEQYIPFYVKEDGQAIKQKVNSLVSNMLSSCGIKIDVVNEIISFCNKTFGTIHEAPWEDDPTSYTFKTNKTKKWYGLIMNIKASSLGLDGDYRLDIMNIKLNPKTIEELIDYKQFFPAYHMNKKYWITILLNKETNLNKVYSLIKQSYNLADNK